MIIGTFTTDIFNFLNTLNLSAALIELATLNPRAWIACTNAGKDLHANHGNVSTLGEPACRNHSKGLPSCTATPAEFVLVDS